MVVRTGVVWIPQPPRTRAPRATYHSVAPVGESLPGVGTGPVLHQGQLSSPHFLTSEPCAQTPGEETSTPKATPRPIPKPE